jgi:hypothetical protein
MKSYTDISQSRKLAEILPLESADMSWYKETEMFPFELHTLPYSRHFVRNDGGDELIPCWTVAAIIELLPHDIKGYNLMIYKSYCPNEKNFAYELSYEGDFSEYGLSILASASSIELIDACVEMITRLHEQKLL